ncbi:hypothetical protein P7C70_g5454, partial [Phenoliferia sp. Uapishka_3]
MQASKRPTTKSPPHSSSINLISQISIKLKEPTRFPLPARPLSRADTTLSDLWPSRSEPHTSAESPRTFSRPSSPLFLLAISQLKEIPLPITSVNSTPPSSWTTSERKLLIFAVEEISKSVRPDPASLASLWGPIRELLPQKDKWVPDACREEYQRWYAEAETTKDNSSKLQPSPVRSVPEARASTCQRPATLRLETGLPAAKRRRTADYPSHLAHIYQSESQHLLHDHWASNSHLESVIPHPTLSPVSPSTTFEFVLSPEEGEIHSSTTFSGAETTVVTQDGNEGEVEAGYLPSPSFSLDEQIVDTSEETGVEFQPLPFSSHLLEASNKDEVANKVDRDEVQTSLPDESFVTMSDRLGKAMVAMERFIARQAVMSGSLVREGLRAKNVAKSKDSTS